MNIVLVGGGYVGLVSSAGFAEFGANVVCVDVDQERINELSAGRIPLYEPDLDELVARNVAAGRLSFSSDLAAAVPQADLIFLAVGTPARHGDGHADLSFIYAAAEEIAVNLAGYTVIVDKSTVPVGTAREVARIVQKANSAADFDVASNPEFLREGQAVGDFLNPERVVLGVESSRAHDLLRELYRPAQEAGSEVLFTTLESAEIIKYASNAFLATKISFINEIAQLCESANADVLDVARGMGLDSRIGSQFLKPGPGYGGSCFPKDTLALIRTASELGVSSRVVEAAVEANASHKARMTDKVRTALGGSVAGKRLAVLGLTFKAETDDMRDSPALSILPALLDKGADLAAYDPQGMQAARSLLPDRVEYHDDVDSCVRGADAVVIMTEWPEFADLDLQLLSQKMAGVVFVDLRNLYEPEAVRAAGFEYHGVGRV